MANKNNNLNLQSMVTGDVLLVKTKLCFISYLIRKITKSEYNHCALVLDHEYILDYTANNLKIKKAKKYFNKFLYKTKIVRIKELSHIEKTLIIKRAFEIDRKFKFEYHKLLISYFQIAGKKIPIRNTCSGLVSRILQDYCNVSFNKPYYLMTPEDLNKTGVEI